MTIFVDGVGMQEAGDANGMFIMQMFFFINGHLSVLCLTELLCVHAHTQQNQLQPQLSSEQIQPAQSFFGIGSPLRKKRST